MSNYVKRATIRVATDMSMTTVLNTTGSQFSLALDERLIEVAADLIASNPTVAAAAAAAAEDAVADEIANGDLLASIPETSVPATSRTSLPITFREKTRATLYPSVYPSVYPPVTWVDGGRKLANLPVLGEDGLIPQELLPEVDQIFTGLKARSVEDGPLTFEVREDGTTYIANLVTGGDTGTTVRRVYVVGALGQSNAVAHGQPVVDILDGVSSRIWQMPYGGSALIPAAVPLTTPGETASGLAPAHVLAREIAANDPECVVVIVPAAKGGSGLATDPAMGYGCWAVDYTGPNQRLYSNATSMMDAAISAATTRWGLIPTVLGTWLQAEADGADGVTRSQYVAKLDPLISDWQGRYGGVFLIGGINPQTATTGTRGQIVLAQQDTPRRVQKTAYTPGVDNGGGSRGPSDLIHYGREAIEKIGRDWFKAIPRAVNNTTDSHTVPPLQVSATRWGNEVIASWTPPYCRVTAYEVQSSVDGTTWSNVTISEPVATTVSFTSSVPVKVRVRAIGTETSAWTVPVIALGG